MKLGGNMGEMSTPPQSVSLGTESDRTTIASEPELQNAATAQSLVGICAFPQSLRDYPLLITQKFGNNPTNAATSRRTATSRSG